MLPKPGGTVAMGVKARVLHSRLLTDDDYNVLLGCDSIVDAAEILKTAGDYGELISALPASIHRIDLESAVRNSLVKKAGTFLPYTGGARRAFFDSWLDCYEAENIKNIFRWIRSRRLERSQMERRLYKIPSSKISYTSLLDSKNFEEAHNALLGTIYHPRMAAAVKRLIAGENSLFSLEMAIDIFCETRLYRNLYMLDADERMLISSYFDSRIDVLNLYNLMRCLLYYNMSLAETLSHTLPVKHIIRSSHLRYIANGITWDERLDRLESISATYAGIFRNALQSPDFELSLEMSMKRFGYLRALAVFHKGSPGFHTAIAYLVLKSYEIDDVIRVIEDVRYDYDRRTAAQYLTRPITVTGGGPAWR